MLRETVFFTDPSGFRYRKCILPGLAENWLTPENVTRSTVPSPLRSPTSVRALPKSLPTFPTLVVFSFMSTPPFLVPSGFRNMIWIEPSSSRSNVSGTLPTAMSAVPSLSKSPRLATLMPKSCDDTDGCITSGGL